MQQFMIQFEKPALALRQAGRNTRRSLQSVEINFSLAKFIHSP